jgi:hypothetical protein
VFAFDGDEACGCLENGVRFAFETVAGGDENGAGAFEVVGCDERGVGGKGHTAAVPLPGEKQNGGDEDEHEGEAGNHRRAPWTK